MIRFLFSFSGRLGPGPYAILTLVFAALVVGAAFANGAEAWPAMMTFGSPWRTLGGALDNIVRLPSRPLDLIVSLAVLIVPTWIFLAMTSRRLRDIDQSPWWSLLVVLCGLTIPVMVILSMLRPAGSGSLEAPQRITA